MVILQNYLKKNFDCGSDKNRIFGIWAGVVYVESA